MHTAFRYGISTGTPCCEITTQRVFCKLHFKSQVTITPHCSRRSKHNRPSLLWPRTKRRLTLPNHFSYESSACHASVGLSRRDCPCCCRTSDCKQQTRYWRAYAALIKVPAAIRCENSASQIPHSILMALGDSYIAASYIKYVESAGAQAVPIHFNSTKEVRHYLNGPPRFCMDLNVPAIETRLTRVNGLLFPGGGTYPYPTIYGQYYECNPFLIASRVYQVRYSVLPICQVLGWFSYWCRTLSIVMIFTNMLTR